LTFLFVYEGILDDLTSTTPRDAQEGP